MVNTMPKGNSENFVKQLELVLEANKDKRLITLYIDNYVIKVENDLSALKKVFEELAEALDIVQEAIFDESIKED